MPPRVFVSSVIEGFEEHRQAARDGIEAAGCEPVMVNEDFSALAASPRNACLDAVQSCDVYVGILGARAGSIAPSGLTIVEEEHEEAQREGLPTLIFIQGDCEREARQEEFVRRVSEFVGGAHRRTFRTAADLSREIQRALEEIDVHAPENPEEAADLVDERLREPPILPGDSPIIAVAIKSVRNEELVDPRYLDSMGGDILRLGHERGVGLFDYEIPYRREVQDDFARALSDPAGVRVGPGIAAVELSEAGLLYVEASASRARESGAMIGMAHHVIHEEDLERQLARVFSFARTLFSELDEYERHRVFMYNAALRHGGYLRIVRDFDPHTSSVTMGMGVEDPVIAYEAARRTARSVFPRPTDEIERTIAVLRRKVNR